MDRETARALVDAGYMPLREYVEAYPMIELRLPVPVSVNAMYRNVAKVGRVKTGKYTNWLKEADKWLLTQKRGLKPFEGPCAVELRVPAKCRADVSNLIKCAEDFLVSRLITPDDRYTRKVSAERDASLTDHCVITVRAA